MVDEIYDRTYQQARSGMNDGMDRVMARFANAIGTTFRVMQSINFASPWKQGRRSPDNGCA